MRTNRPCGYFVFPLTRSAWQLFLWRTSFSISCWGTLVNRKRCIYSKGQPGTGVVHYWLTVVASLCPNMSLICFKNFFFSRFWFLGKQLYQECENLLICYLLYFPYNIWCHLNSPYCNKSVLCCSELLSPVLEHLTALNLLSIALFVFLPVCICWAVLFYETIIFILIKIGSFEWRGFGEAGKTKRFCCCWYCFFALVDLKF